MGNKPFQILLTRFKIRINHRPHSPTFRTQTQSGEQITTKSIDTLGRQITPVHIFNPTYTWERHGLYGLLKQKPTPNPPPQ